MDLADFRAFLVLADTRNYWRAASRLFLAQSTLSKHIQQMEKELGVTLFVRSSRRVELTRYGKLLLPYAKKIVETEEEYTEKITNLREAEKGRIFLSTISSMAEYRITDLLVGFSKAYPDYQIKILEEDSIRQKELLRQNQCELAFVRESADWPASDSDFVKLPYARDHMIALLPKGHPLAGEKSIRLEQLRQEQFALMNHQTVTAQLCVEACLRAGFRPQVTFTSNRLYNLFDAVSQGDFVSLVMKGQTWVPVHSNLPPHSAFVQMELEPPVLSVISLCYRKNEPLSPGSARFVQFVAEQRPRLFPDSVLP